MKGIATKVRQAQRQALALVDIVGDKPSKCHKGNKRNYGEKSMKKLISASVKVVNYVKEYYDIVIPTIVPLAAMYFFYLMMLGIDGKL